MHGEQGQWEVRYRQAEEELQKLRLELSRATEQFQEQSTAVAAMQTERRMLQSRVTELEHTVVQREVSVESVQAELKRAMEMQEIVLSERAQWEGRYRHALQEVQTQLERIQATAEVETTYTTTTTQVTRLSEATESSEELENENKAEGL